MKISCESSVGQSIVLNAESTTTIKEFKEKIRENLRLSEQYEVQLYRGDIELKDDDKLVIEFVEVVKQEKTIEVATASVLLASHTGSAQRVSLEGGRSHFFVKVTARAKIPVEKVEERNAENPIGNGQSSVPSIITQGPERKPTLVRETKDFKYVPLFDPLKPIDKNTLLYILSSNKQRFPKLSIVDDRVRGFICGKLAGLLQDYMGQIHSGKGLENIALLAFQRLEDYIGSEQNVLIDISKIADRIKREAKELSDTRIESLVHPVLSILPIFNHKYDWVEELSQIPITSSLKNTPSGLPFLYFKNADIEGPSFENLLLTIIKQLEQAETLMGLNKQPNYEQVIKSVIEQLPTELLNKNYLESLVRDHERFVKDTEPVLQSCINYLQETLMKLKREPNEEWRDGYSRVLMLSSEPSQQNLLSFDTIGLLQKDGNLTAYWFHNGQITSKSFKVDSDEDIRALLNDLPNTNEVSQNKELIKRITSKYGFTWRDKRIESISKEIEELENKKKETEKQLTERIQPFGLKIGSLKNYVELVRDHDRFVKKTESRINDLQEALKELKRKPKENSRDERIKSTSNEIKRLENKKKETEKQLTKKIQQFGLENGPLMKAEEGPKYIKLVDSIISQLQTSKKISQFMEPTIQALKVSKGILEIRNEKHQLIYYRELLGTVLIRLNEAKEKSEEQAKLDLKQTKLNFYRELIESFYSGDFPDGLLQKLQLIITKLRDYRSSYDEAGKINTEDVNKRVDFLDTCITVLVTLIKIGVNRNMANRMQSKLETANLCHQLSNLIASHFDPGHPESKDKIRSILTLLEIPGIDSYEQQIRDELKQDYEPACNLGNKIRENQKKHSHFETHNSYFGFFNETVKELPEVEKSAEQKSLEKQLSTLAELPDNVQRTCIYAVITDIKKTGEKIKVEAANAKNKAMYEANGDVVKEAKASETAELKEAKGEALITLAGTLKEQANSFYREVHPNSTKPPIDSLKANMFREMKTTIKEKSVRTPHDEDDFYKKLLTDIINGFLKIFGVEPIEFFTDTQEEVEKHKQQLNSAFTPGNRSAPG